MKNARKLLLAAASAACLCFTAPLALPAAGQGFNSWEGSEEVETPAHAFLGKYGKLIFTAVPVLMLILYIVIMGPADVFDAAKRCHRMNRYRGFGSNGGFGGRTWF